MLTCRATSVVKSQDDKLKNKSHFEIILYLRYAVAHVDENSVEADNKNGKLTGFRFFKNESDGTPVYSVTLVKENFVRIGIEVADIFVKWQEAKK